VAAGHTSGRAGSHSGVPKGLRGTSSPISWRATVDLARLAHRPASSASPARAFSSTTRSRRRHAWPHGQQRLGRRLCREQGAGNWKRVTHGWFALALHVRVTSSYPCACRCSRHPSTRPSPPTSQAPRTRPAPERRGNVDDSGLRRDLGWTAAHESTSKWMAPKSKTPIARLVTRENPDGRRLG
jgi:hypothetical protein